MAAACSNDYDESEQVIDVPVVETGIAITFSGQQGEEAVTRATTPLSEAGVTTFKVWGYKNNDYDEGTGSYSGLQTVFPGYAVDWTRNSAATSITNSDGWEYILTDHPDQTIKYWDWGTKAYRFFGATNWNGDRPADPASYVANKTYGAYGTEASTYEISMAVDCSGATDEAIATKIAAMPYFSKLWFSTGNTITYPKQEFGKPVQLEFMKPYTRVRFLFNYAYASEGIKIKKQEFKPTDDTKITLKGTVTVIYPLTGTATKESYSVTAEASPSLDAFTEEYIPEGTEKWYTVLPRPNQGSYTMYVRMNNDSEDKTAVVPAQFMTWLPGYSYTYIFKITEQGGVEIDLVQSAFTPWSEMDGEREVYNW